MAGQGPGPPGTSRWEKGGGGEGMRGGGGDRGGGADR